MKYVIALVVTAALAWIAHSIDLAKDLGAHPWWSQKIVGIGLGIGLTAALLLHFALSKQVLASVVAALSTAVAFGVAKYGQTQFAASFAEDAFAGKLWFFGWHATSAAVFATLALIILALFGATEENNSR